MTTIEMSVYIDCPGCESKIKKALQKLDGVDEVDIDMAMQKVTVMGYADQTKVLKTARKTGMRAELWDLPHNPEYHDITNHYNYSTSTYTHIPQQYHNYRDHSRNEGEPVNHYSLSSRPDDGYYEPPPSVWNSSYDYHKHGYDGQDHEYHHRPARSDMFSDDNPNACSVM